MKKRIIALFVAALMIVMQSNTIFAANIEGNYRLRWDMTSEANNPAYVEWHVDTQSLQVTYTNSDNFFQLRDASNPDTDQKSKLFVKEGGRWTEIPNVTSKIVGVADELDETWDSEMFDGDASYKGSPTYQTLFLQFFQNGNPFAFNGGVEYGVYFEMYTDGYPHGSLPDDIFGFSNPQTSSWALAEIGKAENLDLIPDCLNGADLSKPITRAEFAAVSVKVYEALTGKKAAAASVNPFTDTKDTEVLKAYNIGVTTGVSDTEFAPNVLLNREQAATMLTRVFKTVNNITNLDYQKPVLFSDDKNISSWAYDSVYFMAAKGIIKGMDGNKFAPRNVTSAEEATGFANATREQSLLIAVRMVENLK